MASPANLIFGKSVSRGLQFAVHECVNDTVLQVPIDHGLLGFVVTETLVFDEVHRLRAGGRILMLQNDLQDRALDVLPQLFGPHKFGVHEADGHGATQNLERQRTLGTITERRTQFLQNFGAARLEGFDALPGFRANRGRHENQSENREPKSTGFISGCD